MTIQLKLNTEAVALLFPEGSTARVDLQNAVVAEFLRKHIKPQILADGLKSQIDTKVAEARKDALRQLGVLNGWGGVDLSSEMTRKVREAVAVQVNAAMEKAIEEYASSPEAQRRFQERLDRVIEHRFTKALDTLVDARLKEIKDKL